MAFDKKNDSSFSLIYHNNSSGPSKKCNKQKQLKSPVLKNKEGVPVGNVFDDSSCRWSLSADEDYIVLCFREDGVFDVVNDGKGVKSEAAIRGLDGKHKNSRPVNRKLKYDEDAEHVRVLNIREQRSKANKHNTNQQYQDCITPSKENEEKDSIYMDRQQHRDSMERKYQIEGIEDLGMVSAESRDSHQSESSKAHEEEENLANVVKDGFLLKKNSEKHRLGWEWIGSPIQMPKSEDLNLRKKKVRSVRFQCCRF